MEEVEDERVFAKYHVNPVLSDFATRLTLSLRSYRISTSMAVAQLGPTRSLHSPLPCFCRP